MASLGDGGETKGRFRSRNFPSARENRRPSPITWFNASSTHSDGGSSNRSRLAGPPLAVVAVEVPPLPPPLLPASTMLARRYSSPDSCLAPIPPISGRTAQYVASHQLPASAVPVPPPSLPACRTPSSDVFHPFSPADPLTAGTATPTLATPASPIKPVATERLSSSIPAPSLVAAAAALATPAAPMRRCSRRSVRSGSVGAARGERRADRAAAAIEARRAGREASRGCAGAGSDRETRACRRLLKA